MLSPTKHLLEIELNLLYTYIDHPDLFEGVAHLVSENIFLRPVTKATYKVIKDFHSTGVKPDLNLIFAKLKTFGFSAYDCVAITGGNYDYSYVNQTEKYVDVLFKHSVANYLMPILSDTHQKLLSETGDVLELMTVIKDAITNVELVFNNVNRDKDISNIVDEALKQIEDAKNSEDGFGYSSGLGNIDKITGGISPGIIVVGARPSMGKTSFIVNIIKKNAIDLDVPVVMFSLEMPATQIVKNLFANIYEINSFALKTGQISDEENEKIKQNNVRFKKNLTIDDTAGITWQYVDAKLRKIRKTIPITQPIVVMIDYLQLMSNTPEETKNKTDEAIMSVRCTGLNNLWKKHNACIIELSQLGRDVEKRSPPRPKMSDLKDSGAIEANADIVILLYRPDYYDEFPKDDKGNDLRGLVEFGIPKNRHGKKGAAYGRFLNRYSKFIDYVESAGITLNEDNPAF